MSALVYDAVGRGVRRLPQGAAGETPPETATDTSQGREATPEGEPKNEAPTRAYSFPSPESIAALRYEQSTENLAWLIAILNRTADELERWGSDIDANVLRAHAGQLARGKQWPGGDFSTLEDDLARAGAAT